MSADAIVAAANQLTVLCADTSPDPDAMRRVLAELDAISLRTGTTADPVPALVAEHCRLEAEYDRSYDEKDEDGFYKRGDETSQLTDPIEQQIAGMVAESVAGVCGQLWLLCELLSRNNRNDARENQLFRSIVIGICVTGKCTTA
jgi:hypothetical protein